MSKKINLMYLIRPAAGGMKEHLISLIKHIDRSKYQVFLACPSDPGLNRELDGLDVTILNVNLAGELKPKADLKTVWQLVGYLRKYQINILHIHSSKAGLVGRVAALMARTPAVVFTVHNFIFYDHMSAAKKRIYALAEGILARYTDKIIAVSKALAKGLVEDEGISTNRIVSIYNGIDTTPFEQAVDKGAILQNLGLDPQFPVVGTVARLAPQKGVKHLLDAAKVVQNKHPQVQFLIIGDGPLMDELRQQKESLGLRGVVFAGYRENIAPLMKSLDVFVLPSITEGLGLTILEAMAAEKPVVATAVGGVPEVVVDGETGLLVPAGDGQRLGSAIISLVEDKHLQKAMGISGRQRVAQQFSLTSMIEETEKIYSLVSNKCW